MQAERMDTLYRDTPPDKIPWNREDPPSPLVELVEHKTITPCKVLDIGCGLGHYATYLAGEGFEVTGLDLSPVAVTKAAENAKSLGVSCRFLAADILGDVHELSDTFDFAYDWGVLHHVMPEDRPKFADNVARLLNPHGKHLCVCFSEDDPQFGGVGKYRNSALGTRLYFSSERELEDLFARKFDIDDIKKIGITGRNVFHRAVYVLMHKR